LSVAYPDKKDLSDKYFDQQAIEALLDQRDLLVCKILRAMKGAMREAEVIRLPLSALYRRMKSINEILDHEQPEIDGG